MSGQVKLVINKLIAGNDDEDPGQVSWDMSCSRQHIQMMSFYPSLDRHPNFN